MKHFRLTRQAVADIRAIGRYTSERWGERQRNTYLRQLNTRFAWLAENPHLGRRRPEIDATYFSYPEGEHLVFYRIAGDTIEIIGIPHRSMDIQRHFGKEEEAP